MSAAMPLPPRLLLAERLTLAVLLSGVASLALSDFVSPFYWSIVVLLSVIRLWRGPTFSLKELHASLIGWAGLLWVGLELFLGRAWVVAFTDFLLILSLAIVIEEATPRNHLHRMLVGFFLILGAAVLTDSVLYVFPLAAFMWFVWRAAACLYGMQLPGGDLPLAAWRSDMRIMVMMTAITGLLFMALPRFDFHSYLKPVQPRMQTSGFSTSVQLGDFARTLDPTVVMRIEPVGEDVESFRKQMMGRYWRGTSLARYTGSGWEQLSATPVLNWRQGGEPRFSQTDDRVGVALYREASDHDYLFVPDGLNRIVDAPEVMYLDNQGSIRFRQAPSRRLRLLMQLGKQDADRLFLRPPVAQERDGGSVPEPVAAWAATVVGAAADPAGKLGRLMTELKGWTYDLEAPVDHENPVTSFLQLKRGHCELYATALALAARSLGIPARIVNGYSAGEWNAVGGFYLIRQQHAHSWVEAWVDGRWRRFDPTPASRWQLSGVRFPALDEVWESIRLGWYRYVLEFQDSDRSQALQSLIAAIKRYAVWVMMAAAGVALLIRLKRGGISFPRPNMAADRWSMLDRWLKRRGVERKLYQPLRSLSTPAGVAAERWGAFVRDWEYQAYGNGGRWSRRDLKRHLRALC